MKTPKAENRPTRHGDRRIAGRHPNRVREQDHVTEMLKLCLQKICELQAEIEQEVETTHDPQAEGYTACAMETLRFLSSQGIPQSHPMVKALTEKLLGGRD